MRITSKILVNLSNLFPLRDNLILALLISTMIFTMTSCSDKDIFDGDYSLEVVSRAEAVLKPNDQMDQDKSLQGDRIEEDRQTKTNIVFDPKGRPLQLRVQPSDSQIIINGEWVGNGLFSGRFTLGSTISAEFRRDGFREQSMRITVTEGVSDFRVELEPHPVVRRISVPPGEGVGDLLTPDWGIITYINSKKNLISIDIDNDVLKETELSRFTEFNNDGNLGLSVGRRITSLDSKILLPTDDSLSLIDPQENDKKLAYGKVWSYPLTRGSRMSAGVWNDTVVIVDQVGMVHLISVDTGVSTGQIQTNSYQPRGFAPVVFEDRAVIVGRGGIVSIVDLKNLSVLKEIKVEWGMVHSPVAGSAGVYFFVNNSILGFSWFKDDFFYKIEQVASPPLLFQGRLYYGTIDGRFFVADAATGRILKSTSLGLRVECRPLALSLNRIAVKTDGEILIINTAGMVE